MEMEGTGRSLAPPIEPFDERAYRRFSLPRRIGEAISGCDDPPMARGVSATHMRQDDYVLGLVCDGVARAYPMWVIDNYHAVNDRIGEDRILVASCERCQSGSAFRATPPGNPERPPLFRAVGFLNAVLLLKDLRSGSHWNHHEGVGLSRRAAGLRLPWLPVYHMEWADWLRLWPVTDVMLPPDDERHPDARHGHGREELFSRPGMDPLFLPTLLGAMDDTFPENEMVLGIDAGAGPAAYPLAEVQREGGVVRDERSDAPVVVFAGPRPDGFTMSAFRPSSGDDQLSFERREDGFRDDETGSRWTIDGRAVEGPLEGRRLEPVPWTYVRWHAWVYSHRDTRLFRSRRPAPVWDRSAPDESVAGFGPLVSFLTDRGHEVRVIGPVVSQRRPRDAAASLTVAVDGDRLHLHRFRSLSAARDFEALEGAWSALPYRATVLGCRVRRLGAVVLASDPERRYADPAQVLELSDRLLRWSPVVDDPALGDAPSGEVDPAVGGTGFVEVIRALRLAGWDIVDVGFLPPGQLRTDCENGIGLTIEADRFLLYRFGSHQLAATYASEQGHALAFGPFVLRSTPDTMYLHQAAEILYVGDEHIRWSPLLRDARIVKLLSELCGPTDAGSGA